MDQNWVIFFMNYLIPPHRVLAADKAPETGKRLVRPLQRPFDGVKGGVEIRPEKLRQKKPADGNHRPGHFDSIKRGFRRIGPGGGEFRRSGNRGNRFGGALRHGGKGTETAVWIAKEDTETPYPLLLLRSLAVPAESPKTAACPSSTAIAAPFIC